MANQGQIPSPSLHVSCARSATRGFSIAQPEPAASPVKAQPVVEAAAMREQ